MAKGTNIAERVEALVTPHITELGYRVWDVEYVKEGAEWYLQFHFVCAKLLVSMFSFFIDISSDCVFYF